MTDMPPPHQEPTPPAGAPLNYASATAVNAYTGPAPSKEDKTFAMLSHVLTIVAGFLAPLIVWLIKKDTSPFVDDQAKESLNFQITAFIGYVIGSVTFCFGGFLILFGVWIAATILAIVATIKVNEGIAYRYPFALRLIK